MEESISLLEMCRQLIDLFPKYLILYNQKKKIPEDLEENLTSLFSSIQHELIENPGRLIMLENEDDLRVVKAWANNSYDILDEDELFEEFIDPLSDYDDFWYSFKGAYAYRVQMLRPTFISVSPSREFEIYYSEAMRAWVYGLDISALILCLSIIEDTLRNELAKINPDFAYDWGFYDNVPEPPQNKTAVYLINTAYREKILTLEEQEKAHQIRILRNDAVHDLKTIDGKQTYQAILDTKDLIESILSKPE